MNIKITITLFSLLLFCPFTFSQDKSDELVSKGEVRLKENQQAQVKVDAVYEKTQDILEEYQTLLKVVDGLKVYNKILGKQLANQEDEMGRLNTSISNTAIIERQILPLLTRMLDALDNFIAVDVPFLVDERLKRVKQLRRLIEASQLSNAEKTRRVFEAYQIENDFGSTIETYKGKLNIGQSTFDVDYLRVGRIAFMYRSVGSEKYGYWNMESKSWVEISKSLYKRNIDKGIKMGRQEMAPELLTVPVSTTGENK